MRYTNKKYNELSIEAVERIIEELETYSGYYCDLHNRVFNEDWHYPYTEQAKAMLNEYDVFEALWLVQDYEETNFGSVNTTLSNPVEVAQMVWYIVGEDICTEMCNSIEIFRDCFDDYSEDETNEAIIAELKKMYEI